MTEKEEAGKMILDLSRQMSWDKLGDFDALYFNMEEAKKCSIYMIDKITSDLRTIHEVERWQRIKQEIENYEI